MPADRRVRFTRFSAPYHEGELAGFPLQRAQDFVRRGVAVFDPPDVDVAAETFASMGRAQLLVYAREHLGVAEAPPDQVTDDQIREALRAHVVGAAGDDDDEGGASESTSLDQLDNMDRAHLEAFAKTKLGFGEIDAELADDELRVQIRASAEATVSLVPPPARKGGKARA